MKRTLTLICALLLMALMTAAYADNSPAPTTTPESGARVTLQLKDTPLANALEILFSDRHENYVLSPMPNAPTVTMVLQDVSFQDALQAVLRAAGATCRKENGTYYMSLLSSDANQAMEAELTKQLADLNARLAQLRTTLAENQPEVVATKAAIADVERRLAEVQSRMSLDRSTPSATDGELFVEVIQLRYLRPAEIASMIQTVSGVKTVTSVGTSKLIVRGTKSAIEQAKTLIAQLDDQSAFPQPVRINLNLSVSVTQTDQKPGSLSLSSDGVGTMGTPIKVSLDIEPVIANGKYANDGRRLIGLLSAEVTASAGPEGGIGLKGIGSFGCQIGREIIQKPFDILVLATPGKPIPVASGSYAIEGKTVKFEVRATVAMDDVPTSTVKKPSATPHK